MNSSARGALLLAVAVLLGFLILRGAENSAQVPITAGAQVQVTPTADVEVAPDDSVSVAGPGEVIDPADARPNNEVSVLVANGTNESGQASRLTSTLRNQGFLTAEPRNADPQAVSFIYYRPGFVAEAVVVETLLSGVTQIEAMPSPDPFIGDNIDLAPIDVLVLIGDDELATS